MSYNIYVDTTTFQVGDLHTVKLGEPGQVPKPIGSRKPKIVINNESGCGVECNFSGGRSPFLAAGAWTDPLELEQSDVTLNLLVKYVLPSSPVNTIAITIYRPDETPLTANVLGNSPIGISGSVQTSSVQTLTNDGSSPESVIIETTPTDQTSSSVVDRNTGSGYRQILSAGVLRTVWLFVRGNITSLKAALQLGDSNDTSILTIYGTIGAGSIVPGTTVNGDIAANQIGPGALDSDVTIAGSQVTGDIAVSQVGPGALDSDVTINASQITGSTPTTQIVPSGAQISIQSSTPSSPSKYDVWLKTTF